MTENEFNEIFREMYLIWKKEVEEGNLLSDVSMIDLDHEKTTHLYTQAKEKLSDSFIYSDLYQRTSNRLRSNKDFQEGFWPKKDTVSKVQESIK